MDNRLRFLYCVRTELWGHVWKAQPGNGIPGQAKEESHRKNRVTIQRRDADRTRVGKCVSHASRKAAIVLLKPVP